MFSFDSEKNLAILTQGTEFLKASSEKPAGTVIAIVSRVLKKAVQQGRNERRGEEVHTALCVDRSPRIIDLGERKDTLSISDLREAPPQG
jgi:hypothetical protein